jgi:hypothetical protein
VESDHEELLGLPVQPMQVVSVVAVHSRRVVPAAQLGVAQDVQVPWLDVVVKLFAATQSTHTLSDDFTQVATLFLPARHALHGRHESRLLAAV